MAAELSPETCQANFEQGVAMSLHLWPALTLAVQNNWGGPDSSEKRDWFAGAIVELFPDLASAPANTSPLQVRGEDEPDQIDVERRLLEIMEDEFEVVVDDDSAFEVADGIMRLWASCVKRKADDWEAVRRRWEAGKGRKVVAQEVSAPHADDDDDDEEWDTDEDEDEDEEGGGDVEMDEAPALVPAREKAAPEMDEDGFEKVTRKKR